MNYEDGQFLINRLQETVGMLESVLPTPEERLAEAEQRAWDMYAAAALVNGCESEASASEVADTLLAERRKRFGAGK